MMELSPSLREQFLKLLQIGIEVHYQCSNCDQCESRAKVLKLPVADLGTTWESCSRIYLGGSRLRGITMSVTMTSHE